MKDGAIFPSPPPEENVGNFNRGEIKRLLPSDVGTSPDRPALQSASLGCCANLGREEDDDFDEGRVPLDDGTIPGRAKGVGGPLDLPAPRESRCCHSTWNWGRLLRILGPGIMVCLADTDGPGLLVNRFFFYSHLYYYWITCLQNGAATRSGVLALCINIFKINYRLRRSPVRSTDTRWFCASCSWFPSCTVRRS